ncbi:MAG: DUF420 domain-containing protein [Pirellulaceae bacterium]
MDGFLGTRGSVMLDVVVVAMVAVLPILVLNVSLARFARQYELHKRLQLLLALSLLAVIVAFEVDIHFFSDWKSRAKPSPYFDSETWSWVWISLILHLSFSIPTLVLWVYVIIQAIRHMPRPATPSVCSGHHVFWGRLATAGMMLTSISGWVFYWLAFVAE